MNHKKSDIILILDFGSQYTQLIARRIRECNVYSEIVPYNISIDEIVERKPKGIVLSGGPASVTYYNNPICERKIFKLGIPILGICYGMQLMAKLLGGNVSYSHNREYGYAVLKTEKKNELFHDLNSEINVWMSHGDKVTKLPDGFEIIGHTSNSPIAVMCNKEKKLYGVQFHPEVVHTQNGKKIFRNFLYRIAGSCGNWTMVSFIRETLINIRDRVGNEKVICALSGGVDSSVLAVLLHKAIGKKFVCLFVNNGLLRKNEAESVIKRFKNYYKINLKYINAEKRFLKRLKGITNPEQKRNIIGKEFIRIFEEEANKIGSIRFLAQGTLYPDVIESHSPGKGPSATIKTHHNVGGLPKRMKMELIEPFRELFKDEVRIIGKKLGMPEEIIRRQPFPGPGLAVRIIGEVTPERLFILREADSIVIEETKKANIYRKIWQSFAVLIPVKTVGVMGDERTYENVIAVRAVVSHDGMTADWAKLPPELLGKISNRIINEVKGVNRVVYDISSKPPSTIEWE